MIYWVVRRELAVTLRAPIAYLVGGLFLVVQGLAFAGNLDAMADATRAAPLGAILEGQLAGTLLTWTLTIAVVALLGMRAIADDKRTGQWELLLTARVSERAAVVGKWLAATLVYALLWIPTLAYLAVIAVYRSGSGGWDAGAIASGYLGAIAVGAVLLAWTIAASAATSNPLVAGALGFALALGLFLAGELGPFVGNVDAISLRAHLLRLARGDLSLQTIALFAGLTITGLSLAVSLACVGRRRHNPRRFASTLCIAVLAAACVIEAGRHPLHLDATGKNALPDVGPEPATLTIVAPTLGALQPLYDEVARVAQRFADAGPITVRRVDPASAPGGLTAVAAAAGLAANDLAASGAVIVDVANRRTVVDVFQLAQIERGADGPSIQRVAIEDALARALAPPTPYVACFTTGHGELPLTRDAKGADWALVTQRLQDDGATLSTTLDARCKVVVIAGPTTPLPAETALAIQQLHTGLVVAAASRMVEDGLASTGVEALLDGMQLPAAIGVDPSLAVRELPGGLLISTGYADHVINAGFQNTRATLWYQPRVVVGGTSLISASPNSWGERDLIAPPQKTDSDLDGPISVASVSPRGVIAIGSAESFTTAVGSPANTQWLARAIRFAARAPLSSTVFHRADELRLVMTDSARHVATALCVGGIPLAWLVLGGAVVLLRRRRSSNHRAK